MAAQVEFTSYALCKADIISMLCAAPLGPLLQKNEQNKYDDQIQAIYDDIYQEDGIKKEKRQ